METNTKIINVLRFYPKNIIDNTLIMDKLQKRLMVKNPSEKGDNLMFTVTDKASEVIKDFLKDKNENSAIRITMSIG
ncbi:MAG: hypothetical protein AB2L12_03665 [Smithellaceae bacterium]